MPAERDQSRLVEETANRLRMIQLDLADETPEARQDYMSDEVERAANSLPTPQRAAFLDELLGRFPSWDTKVDVTAPTDAVVSTRDEEELRDASFLVTRLVEVAATLDDAERKALGDRLAAGGLAPPRAAGGSWRPEAGAAVCKVLGLAEDEPLDATRVAEGYEMFADFAIKIDSIIWKMWQEIAPRSRLRGGRLKRNASKFSAGDETVVRGNIKNELESTRNLGASLILAIRQAAGTYGQKHETKYAPSAIERAVEMEGGKRGFMEAKEVAYWRKYCELAQDLNKRALEREILDAVAEYASQVMEGQTR